MTLEPIPEAKQKIRGGKPPRSPIKVFKNNLKLNFSSTFLSSKSQSKHLNNDQSIQTTNNISTTKSNSYFVQQNMEQVQRIVE